MITVQHAILPVWAALRGQHMKIAQPVLQANFFMTYITTEKDSVNYVIHHVHHVQSSHSSVSPATKATTFD